MRVSKSKRDEQWKMIAFTFFLFAALLLGLGLALKVYLVFSATQFDGTHQFVLSASQNTTQEVFAFSPDAHTLTELSLSGVQKPNLSLLGIPTDASSSQELPTDIHELGHALLFHTPNGTHLTIVDKIRLFLFLNSLKQTDIVEKSFTLPQDSTYLENSLSQLLTDHTMYTQGVSVSVVNGTTTSGLGTNVAHMLSAIGANVVSVTTAPEQQKQTVLVYTGQLSYTAKRIAQLFHAHLVSTSTPGVSDLTLQLGTDSSSIF